MASNYELVRELQDHIALVQASIERDEFATEQDILHPFDSDDANGRVVMVDEVRELVQLVAASLRTIQKNLNSRWS